MTDVSEPQVTMTGPARLRALADDARLQGYAWLSDDLAQLAALWNDDLGRAVQDRAALERLSAAASGRGMVSEMDDMAEVAVLVCGLHDRAEKAEAALYELGLRLAAKAMALQEAEESIDRLQSTKKDLTAEIKGLYAARPTLSEWAELTQALSKAEAALEIAQAKADLIGGEVCAEARAAGRGPCGACAWCVKQATDRAERAEAALERARALADEWIAGDGETYGDKLMAQMGLRLAAALDEGGRP